jgi:phage baseplate assembly protein W
MAITRADTLTSTLKKQEYFSDFLTSFAYSPIGNNLGRVVNENSIKQSLKNLIMTNVGERLFQPTIGSNVMGALFEPNSIITLTNIEFYVKNTIKFNEPRVNLLNVSAKNTYDENQIQIDIVFSLINNPEPISLSLILKRVR